MELYVFNYVNYYLYSRMYASRPIDLTKHYALHKIFTLALELKRY